MFDCLVDPAEPICQKIDLEKAFMLLFDTSGMEAWVTENNPKYANRIIRQLKAYKKAKGLDDSYDPYKAAYGSMLPHAASKALIPVLKDLDFFKKPPLINPKTFLGDSAFDSIEIYKCLLQKPPFQKAYIPLKNKLKIEGTDYAVNEEGIPCWSITRHFP